MAVLSPPGRPGGWLGRWSGEVGQTWQVLGSVLAVGQLVISELVANAVEHAATVCEVCVEFDGRRLQLAVRVRASGCVVVLVPGCDPVTEQL
jgi:anti-sigma regulatory factor (Ser/Thr protein kinase)